MVFHNEGRDSKARVVSQAIVTQDITEEFTRAASKLRTGQLVKDEYFTLFEAVGALEIMDSKMDSGYLGPGESHAQALEYDYDFSRELTPAEVVGIMDQLLCLEMAWHMGHPLSQTLFTSVYLDKLLWPVPRTIEEACFVRDNKEAGSRDGNALVHLVLRAYCLALVKCCAAVHERITAEYFYEEEDFVSQLYNRSLLPEVDVQEFHGLLDQAISWVDEHSDMIATDKREAIWCRLLFRQQFLDALCHDVGFLDSRSTDKFGPCVSTLPLLAESSSLGQLVEAACSLKIQRKLASTVPPRPMVKISFDKAITHLRRLCQDAVDLQDALCYRGADNLKVAIWTLASRKPPPSLYIRALLQTVIVHDMRVLGRLPIKRVLYDDLRELVLPASELLEADIDSVEIPTNPNFQIAQLMDDFVKRFAQPFLDTLRTACLNRCRIRRTLCHVAQDWDNLQMEAEGLDTQIRKLRRETPLTLRSGERTFTYPLSSWAYHQKLGQLRLIIQMGFELSIYAPEELPGMYWYLSHICSTHLSHIERIRTFTMAARQRTSTGVLKSSNITSEQSGAAIQTSLRLLERLAMQLIAIDAFAIALHALYVLLARHRALPTASSTQAYSNDQLRYELRMKPFIPISLPELVPFDDYHREATLDGDSDGMVLERASRAIAEARKAWETILANGPFSPSHDAEIENSQSTDPTAGAIAEEWKRDVKDTMRACIGASIAIETLRKNLTTDTETSASNNGVSDSKTAGRNLDLHVEIPECGSKLRWHHWWIVPQLTLRSNAPK